MKRRFDLQFHDIDSTAQLGQALMAIAQRFLSGEPYHDGAYEMYQSARDERGEVIGQYRLKEVRSES